MDTFVLHAMLDERLEALGAIEARIGKGGPVTQPLIDAARSALTTKDSPYDIERALKDIERLTDWHWPWNQRQR